MKKAEKFEVGKRVAAESNGLIELTVEDGVATLRGEFDKHSRKPLRYKKGAGWLYHKDANGEFWTLNVSKLAEPKAEAPKAEKAEPKEATIYVRTWGYGMTIVTFYEVTRSTESSVWLRQVAATEKPADKYGQYGTVTPCRGQFVSNEFRKSLKDGAERLSGGFYVWDGKPASFNYMD